MCGIGHDPVATRYSYTLNGLLTSRDGVRREANGVKTAPAASTVDALSMESLTIGTLDGANIEIREAVGHENFFLFGLTADEVARRKAEGYTPRSIYESNLELREAIDLIASGFFSDGDRGLFHPLVESLLVHSQHCQSRPFLF